MLKATPVITWPTPRRYHLRDGAQRDAAERDGEHAGTFVYTPAAGTVLNAGAAQTLSVTFTPTDAANYTTATKTVSINVLKATPVITWATPADITYGTALGATQLNATANTPGTFVYSPVAGDGAERRCGADAVGHLHADRRRELHDRDEDGCRSTC